MDTEARCPLTDLFMAQCAHCLGLKTPEEEAAAQKQAEDEYVASMYGH